MPHSQIAVIDSNGVTQDIDYGGETFGWKNTIEFYDPAFGIDPLDPKFRNNVVHEFAHGFNSEIVSASNGEVNPYDDLKVALATGELSRFDPREGMEEYPWQQHPNDDSANELFADYFLNMTYGSFKNNDAGTAQYAWMNSQMSVWMQR